MFKISKYSNAQHKLLNETETSDPRQLIFIKDEREFRLEGII
jgi:hypothetical protein